MMTDRRRGRQRTMYTRALLTGLLSALAWSYFSAPSVAGVAGPMARQEESTLTWSVRPTPTAEQPERPNFSYDLEPGTTVRDSIRVRNFDGEPLSLDIYASDALTTPNGALDLLPAGEEPTGVGAWIVLEESTIEVPSQEFVDVPFTMTVPDGAEPGDHTGGIVTSFVSQATGDDGQPLAVDRRLGNRVQVRAAGELRPALEVTDLEVTYSGTWNPFGSGTAHVTYTVTNTGNVRLAADQLVSAEGLFGLGGGEVAPDPMPELLPDNSLSFSVEVPGVWPTFRTSGSVQLQPIPTREGNVFDPDTTPTAASASTWAVPWTQLALLLLLVGGPFTLRWVRRRRRRREDERVREAVEAALAGRDGEPADAP